MNNDRTLTRPATPRAFHVGAGRYSFVPVSEPEEIEQAKDARSEKVTVPNMPAAKR